MIVDKLENSFSTLHDGLNKINYLGIQHVVWSLGLASSRINKDRAKQTDFLDGEGISIDVHTVANIIH
jgi:hypothetical protein